MNEFKVLGDQLAELSLTEIKGLTEYLANKYQIRFYLEFDRYSIYHEAARSKIAS
jgi:hypothetical protein